MLSLLFGFFIFVSLVFLYGYLNDRKLGKLPPEVELVFSPTRVTPQMVRATAEALSKNPVIMKNFLPPKTGRRYIVIGGVCSFTFSPSVSCTDSLLRQVF